MRHRPRPLTEQHVTPESLYLTRRHLISGLLGTGIGLAVGDAHASLPTGAVLHAAHNAAMSVSAPPNSWDDITTYNNYYEFGTDKSDPAQYAGSLRVTPWTVTIGGEADITGPVSLDDLLKPHALEERIYRLRCVEAWSMVIPWVGIPLGEVLRRFKPRSNAKYVRFTTLNDPTQMPGERSSILHWPYTEGLRLDEAMHPLSLLAVGLYGRSLPNQNGAPLRLVVPWKYGFKSIKAIVGIEFVEREPRSAWSQANPKEYGFYANVNPAVDHPRWSQASERHIGGGLFAPRQPTLPFNGYAEQVADLYRGMDLRRQF